MQYLFHLESPGKLVKNHFINFGESFQKALRQFIPSFNEVVFVHDDAASASILGSLAAREESSRFWAEENDGRSFICCRENQILFTVPAQTKTLGIVSGLDPYFARHVSADWLAGFHRDIVNRFVSIVSAGVDIETGLLNGRRFMADIVEIPGSSHLTILLVELYPRARSSRESELHTAKSVHALRGSIPPSASLYSLRHHVYAVILQKTTRKTAHSLARKLLSRLRMDGFPKVHIGMRCEMPASDTASGHLGLEILVQLRQAGDNARKRGPYALCDYEHILYPERHPLRRPSRKVMARFRKAFHQQDRFCVILFQTGESTRPAAVRRLLGDTATYEDDEDIYVFLADADEDQARRWVADKLALLTEGDVRAGIAVYPYADFGKSQTVFNSRKALRHADFYGPGGLAVFDALSLNISGDIFYEEGDLTSAVKEYKTGLLCNPEETNLLNSLGVCYVDMGRHSLARRCFEEVLRLDGDNFMALVNAGLESLRRENHIEAIGYFEKARSLGERPPEAEEDLAFQLGRLYCLTGKYKRAVDALLSLGRGSEHTFFRERAFAYLGKSYYGIKRYDLAAMWLQKALHADQFDAESMGLLGYVYLSRGEGRDIALSLCAKSVELAPGNFRLRLYLAEVQISCGQCVEARETLAKIPPSTALRQEAKILASESYLREGKPALARRRLSECAKTRLANNLRMRVKHLCEELDGAEGQARKKKGDSRTEV